MELVLCLVIAERLVYPFHPQSCADGKLVPLAGPTMLDWFVREGSDKTTPWTSMLGVGRGLSKPHPCYRNGSKEIHQI